MKKSILYIIVLTLGFNISSCVKVEEKKDYVRKVALNEETIAVGMYKAGSFEYPSIQYLAEAINIDGGIVYVTLSDEDVLKTKLDNIDVLIFPAFEGGQAIDVLDDEIAVIFKKFISKKGAIGFANGCNFFIDNFEGQSVSIFENSDMEAFSGIVNFKLSDEGKSIFPELADKENLMLEMNGKFNIDVKDTSRIDVLADKVSDPESPLFVTTKFEKGKILIVNMQSESTPGMRWMIPRMIRWVYNKDFVYYDDNVFRPNYFTNEIHLDKELNAKLSEFMDLFETGNESEIIFAMNELQLLYPMIAAEKVRVLLIEKNNDIKLRAAQYLVDVEYTAVIDDLKKVIRGERKKVKEQLEGFLLELENMIEQN